MMASAVPNMLVLDGDNETFAAAFNRPKCYDTEI
jgi:hypothetical protein